MFPFCSQTFDILPAKRWWGEGGDGERRQAMPTPSGQLDRHSRRGDATRLQIQPEALLLLLLLNLSLSLPLSLLASLSAAASNVSLCATLACLKFQRIRSCAQRASNGICSLQLATSFLASSAAMPPLRPLRWGRRSQAGAGVARVQATTLII